MSIKEDALVRSDQEPWSFKEWYQKNKEDFNARRRQRYETDPDYRKRVLDMNRTNREKRQKDRMKEDKERKKAITLSAAPSWKEFDGKEGTMVTIGALAKLLNRSTQSIRLWEKHNVIPRTPHRNSRGDRLYTPEQVLEIKNIVKDRRDTASAPRGTEISSTPTDVKLVDGSVTRLNLFRVGVLAKAVNRTVLTLEQMERKGTLPESPFRGAPNRNGDPGHRYYTFEMIESVKKALDDMGGSRLRGDFRKKEFRDRILSEWTAHGVIGAEIVLEK